MAIWRVPLVKSQGVTDLAPGIDDQAKETRPLKTDLRQDETKLCQGRTHRLRGGCLAWLACAGAPPRPDPGKGEEGLSRDPAPTDERFASDGRAPFDAKRDFAAMVFTPDACSAL